MKTKSYENPYQHILEAYPPVITKDQLYRICHISKKTASYLLESGLIPSVSNGKKTRKYKIQTADVVEFLKLREMCPERYSAPEGWYKSKQTKPRWLPLTLEETAELKAGYEARMALYPDVLSSSQAAKILQVSRTTVGKWCRLKRIEHFKSGMAILIPKAWLLEFMLSPQYISNRAGLD